MALPLLRFVAYRDFYIVKVENLTQLTVPQIKQLEAFATERRSTLDFNKASIKIWKRIDYDHFNKTLELAGIVANTIESEIAKPQDAPQQPRHSPKVGFGKYKGLSYSELPNDYLLWLKRNYNGPERSAIENELQARSL
jgi:hypothetical protein